MAHWTINHNSGTGNDTASATPSSKNTSTSSINQTATFTLGSHNKTVSLIHTGAANTVTLSDGDLMDGWFAVMCLNCYDEKQTQTVGKSKLGGSTDEDLYGKQAFWNTTSFPTVTQLKYPALDTEIYNQIINPIPTAAAYAVMDKTDGHKDSSPAWKFKITTKNIAGAEPRLFYGTRVLDAADNFTPYDDSWEGNLIVNPSGSSFDGFRVSYFTNATTPIDELDGKHYDVKFKSPHTSLNFQVTATSIYITDGTNDEELYDWSFGDYNDAQNGNKKTAGNGAYSIKYDNSYIPCVLDGRNKTISNLELSVS